jgi:hypothetical protein
MYQNYDSDIDYNHRFQIMYVMGFFFSGSDAVNCLLESKWAASKSKSSSLFTNRASCVDFCQKLVSVAESRYVQ